MAILTPTIACRFLYSAAQYHQFRSVVKAVSRSARQGISMKKFYYELRLPWSQINLLIQVRDKMAVPPAAPPSEPVDSNLWEHLTGEDLPRIKTLDQFNDRTFLTTLTEAIKQTQR